MPENKELLQYIDEHVSIRDFKGSYFYPDNECVLPKDYLQHQQTIKDFEVFEDDIWVLSYPKCGTTWCQEMVWLIANNLDYKGAENVLDARYSFLEIGAFGGDEIVGEDKPPLFDTIKQAQNMPRPRFIKSHLPLALLPNQLFEKKAKVFFVLRDPRDTAVSYLHHCRLLTGYFGTAEKFYEAFLEGCVIYGSYWHYLAALWKLRQEPNMMVMTYEEMKKDLSDVIRRAVTFLGKPVNDEDMPALLDHLSFAKMKTNGATNYKGFVGVMNSLLEKVVAPDGEFMRKGVVGDYKNAMSEEMMMKFERHNAEMKRKLGLADDKDFPY